MGRRKKSTSTVDVEKHQISAKDTTRTRRSSKRKIIENELSDEEAPLSIQPVAKRRLKPKSTKRSVATNERSKPKKTKTVGKKQNSKESSESEHSFHSSVDSGISSGPTFSNEEPKLEITVENIKASCSKTVEESCNSKEMSSSSESEWEEVEANDEQSLEDYKPEIPKEGVEITIDCPELNIRKRKKKQFDVLDYIRLQVNRYRKEAQMSVHKTHLLCLLAHGFYLNNVLNSSILKCLALSILPTDLIKLTSGKKIDKLTSDAIEPVISWFRMSFSCEATQDAFLDVSNNMVKYFESRSCLNASEYNLLFILFARTLGFKTRMCISFYPVSHKAQNLIKKPNGKQESEKINISSCIKKYKDCKKEDTTPSADIKNESDAVVKQKPAKSQKNPPAKKIPKSNALKETSKESKTETSSRSQRACKKRKSYKVSSDEEGNVKDEDDDEDFELKDEDDFEEQKNFTKKLTKTPKKSNRKILSSDSEPSSPVNTGFSSDKITCWAEIFLKADKEWIAVECVNNTVNKPYEIESNLPQPVSYIIAYDDKSYVKDVTRRYCSEYMTSTIKLRVDSDWWNESLLPFLPRNTKLDKEEEKNLESVLINKPLPTTISGFKNHPLYALKRHLLKFEAIYPPDAASVGFIRSEAVYPRENVAQLHSRETWVKQARVVRVGEEPYKIVKARPKWDRMAGIMRTDLPLEVYGFWQTEPYKPPVAVDGKVPRNEYGNVELFQPSMLPIGTVHIQLPGLNRIAKKLGIDCSPAVVGFDGHKGSIHPVFDGFVICKEYKETILAAWDEEQENARKREEEKREKRIYGNWKKLIKGLLIRERIKMKYDAP